MKRTQIYLDDAQADRLARRARSRGTTKSHLIREAIEAYLARPEDKEARVRAFRDAVRSVAGTVSRLPSGRRYVEALREDDAARERELEERWRA